VDKAQSWGSNLPDDSENTLKRTITLAGFSLLQLSASEFIPRLQGEADGELWDSGCGGESFFW